MNFTLFMWNSVESLKDSYKYKIINMLEANKKEVITTRNRTEDSDFIYNI